MRRQVRKDEIKEINEIIKKVIGIDDFLNKKDIVAEIDGIVFLKDEPILFLQKDEFVPTLKLILKHDKLKKITIDMPAVKFIISGANVMRPGIKEIDDNIKKGEIITIADEVHKKPIAIGMALFDSEEMKKLEKGIVVNNLHYIGDKIWNFKN